MILAKTEGRNGRIWKRPMASLGQENDGRGISVDRNGGFSRTDLSPFPRQVHLDLAGWQHGSDRILCRLGMRWLPTLTLNYRWRDGEEIRIPISLSITPTNFNGERWWFACPLTARGVACDRRAGKLYLPPGARYFGCRKCHDLTYQSCQEAHRSERFFGALDRMAF